jgi:uncharacterized membrane protein
MKELKELAEAIIVLMIYNWATEGMVKWLWRSDNEPLFKARVLFVNYCIVVYTLLYVFGVPHIVSSKAVKDYYEFYVYLNLFYVFLGNLLNILIKNDY